MPTVHQLAGEAYGWFETVSRSQNDYYVRLKEGRPEWVHDLVREAHGDMMPDDWRYNVIQNAVSAIYDAGEDADLDDLEFADSAVDAYNGQRLKWLESDMSRSGYCDEAREQGLVADEADIFDRIGAGQYMEAQEVFALVRQCLEERADEDEEDDEEDDE